MNAARIAAGLEPFLDAPLDARQLDQLAAYLELLLHWNARMNLTAVRDPEHIVTRHMGESLFAASRLLPPPATGAASPLGPPPFAGGEPAGDAPELIDVGSGAGFPGLPMKIYCPTLRLTLLESRQKKAAFLREVIRRLDLGGAEVQAVRAEACPARAGLVTLRAVEQFERVVPVAASLLRRPGAPPVAPATGAGSTVSPRLDIRKYSNGQVSAPPPPRLALLIGAAQAAAVRRLLPDFDWQPAVALPQSDSRVLLVGSPAS